MASKKQQKDKYGTFHTIEFSNKKDLETSDFLIDDYPPVSLYQSMDETKLYELGIELDHTRILDIDDPDEYGIEDEYLDWIKKHPFEQRLYTLSPNMIRHVIADIHLGVFELYSKANVVCIRKTPDKQ